LEVSAKGGLDKARHSFVEEVEGIQLWGRVEIPINKPKVFLTIH